VSAVPAAMRRARILEHIRERGAATIADLARTHAISSMTAHRDLEQLAREGLVVRVRGGARALDAAAPHPTAWAARIAQEPEAKAAIAAHAVTRVEDGATIFLDASSTAHALALALMTAPPRALTLVTNSPFIAANISADAVHLVVCPGELDQQTRAVTGGWTVEFIGRLNFDVAFVSAAGITLDKGLSTARSPIADVLRAARAQAGRTVGLVDATKFGRAALVTIARAQDLDEVVTDSALDAATVDEYRAAGVGLVIAPPR
jgi:DeoR/GlpR family transcriptional regulator of sugar metabolism